MRIKKQPIPIKKREQLRRAMKAKGIDTVRELTNHSGLSYPTVGNLLNHGEGSEAVIEAVQKAIHNYQPKKVKV